MPSDVSQILGVASWSKYLGAISQPDALAEARKLDVIHDEEIRRARGLSEDDHDAIASRGGVPSLRELNHALRGLPPVKSEAEVDLNSPDAIAQLKGIRLKRGLLSYAKADVETTEALLACASARGTDPASARQR